MDAAYGVGAWKDFAVVVGGAAAALAGLLIVAMSINVEEILRFRGLPARAAAALVTMLSPLVVAVLLLVPGQSDVVLGVELVVLGLLLGYGLLGPLGRLSGFREQAREDTLGQWLVGTAAPIALLVGGLVLSGIGVATGAIGGLYWLVPAVLAAVLGGTTQAWVMLIEIRR